MNNDPWDQEITDIEKEIVDWQSYLDIQALLLFTTVLACWSVTQSAFRLVAIIFILVLFFRNALDRIKDSGPFKKRLNNFRRLLINRGDDRYTKIDAILKDRLEFGPVFKRSWPYFVCLFFSLGSFVYFIFLAIPKH